MCLLLLVCVCIQNTLMTIQWNQYEPVWKPVWIHQVYIRVFSFSYILKAKEIVPYIFSAHIFNIRVHEIAYGFGAQILLLMSDKTDEFHEHWYFTVIYTFLCDTSVTVNDQTICFVYMTFYLPLSNGNFYRIIFMLIQLFFFREYKIVYMQNFSLFF